MGSGCMKVHIKNGTGIIQIVHLCTLHQSGWQCKVGTGLLLQTRKNGAKAGCTQCVNILVYSVFI